MRRVVAEVVVALALAACPVLAQSGPLGSLTLEVSGGYLTATRDLGRTRVLDGIGYVAFRRLDPAATLGAGVEAPLFGPMAVRVRADYAFETVADGQWFCDAFMPCPSVLILVEGRVRRWSALADLRLRPAWQVGPLRPTAFLGVGRRAYRLRWDSPVPEVPIPTADDEARWFARTGLGVAVSRGAWSVFTEVDAALNGFGHDAPTFIEGTVPPDGRGPAAKQVDVGVSVGVRFGLQ